MNVSIKLNLLDAVSAPLRKVSEAVRAAGQAMGAVKSAVAAQANGITAALAKASAASQSFRDKAKKSFEQAHHIHQSTQAMERFAEKSRALVEGVVAPFEDFEEAMARVRGGTATTNEEFAALSETARSLGSKGRFGATEMAAALGGLRSEGMSAAEAIAALPSIADAAVVGNKSLAEAIQETTGIMDAFGLSSKDMGHMLDVVSAAAPAAGTSMANLNSTLAGVGQSAVEAGVSMERVTVMAGLLAQKNVDAGHATGALERVFKSLQRPMGEGAEVLKTLGVSTSQTVKGVTTLRDPLTVLTELQDKMTTRGVAANSQVRAFTALLGGSATEVMAMIRASREPGMEKLTESIKNAAGATGLMATDMRKNGKEAALDLNGSMRELGNTMAETLAPAIERIRRVLTDAVTATTKWMKEHPKLTQSIGIVAGAVALGATALAGLMTVLVPLVAAKGMLSLALGAGKFGLALGPMLVPLGLAALAFAAVGVAIAELVAVWDTLDMGEVWDGVKEMSKGGFGGVIDVVGTALDPRTLLKDAGLMSDVSKSFMMMQDVPAAQSLATMGTPLTAAAGTAPTGQIDIHVTSDGQAKVKGIKSKGVELDVTAGQRGR